jgi:hypothetical protein
MVCNQIAFHVEVFMLYIAKYVILSTEKIPDFIKKNIFCEKLVFFY